MKSKQLEVHPDKTCHLVIGNKKDIELTSATIDLNPIMYDSFEVKNKKEAKYLGDYIHQGGNVSSIYYGNYFE